MTNTSTLDTEGSVAGYPHSRGRRRDCASHHQGVREAENMAEIRKGLDAAGCDVPLVADVHFNPNAAFTARRPVRKCA